MGQADVVLFEGFRGAPILMIEVYRPSLGLPALWASYPSMVALVTDERVDFRLPYSN